MYENLLIALAGALAISIGVANSAVAMAPSYGAKIARRRILLPLAAISIIAGAVLFGENVMHTIEKGIVPKETFFSPHVPLAFFINSFFFITLSNILHVPISTTEVVVLSIAGIGIAHDNLNTQNILKIVLWWILGPISVYLISYVFEKRFYFSLVDVIAGVRNSKVAVFLVKVFTVLMGMYFALSAGANNAGNSFGIVAGKGIVTEKEGLWFAGIFMAIGSVIFAKNIIKSVGEGITSLGLLRASVLEFLQGTFILVSTLLGIPVSVNQTLTAGMIGIETARQGVKKSIKENKFIQRIVFFWIAIPLISIFTSIAILKILEKIKLF